MEGVQIDQVTIFKKPFAFFFWLQNTSADMLKLCEKNREHCPVGHLGALDEMMKALREQVTAQLKINLNS